LGILVMATGALTLIFCQRETSDSWADGLALWWDSVKSRMRHVKRLVIYLDNGPKNSGSRTQWLVRMIEFADWSGLEIRRAAGPILPVARQWHDGDVVLGQGL
jgi:hypothetical protein